MSLLREPEPDDRPTAAWRWALVGAAALVPALALAYALRVWAGGLLLPEVAAQYVIERVPGPFALWAVSTLGKSAKPVGLVLAFGCFYIAAAVFGRYFQRLYDVLPGARPWRKGLSFGGVTLLLTCVLLGIVWFTGPGALSQYALLPSLASILLFNLLFGLGLSYAARFMRAAGATTDAAGTTTDAAAPAGAPRTCATRREWLAGAGVVLASAGLVALIARDLLDYIGTGLGTVAGRLPSFLTPNAEFYVVQKEVGTPQLAARRWRLRIEGHVAQPYELDYDELVALAHTERTVTLQCIENPTGGPLISNARWRGVELRTLLERAGVRAGAQRVVVWGAGLYADSLPLATATSAQVILAVAMNGVPLPRAHGFPARLIAPDLYGIKNVKWVERVEVVTAAEFQGYWQVRGWSQAATVKTTAKFSVPVTGATVPRGGGWLGGVAFAGARGVSRVEVSADGGRTWLPAQLAPDALQSETAWAVWTLVWTPPGAGAYTLAVRATDGSGVVQAPEPTSVFPAGAGGYHRINVRVS